MLSEMPVEMLNRMLSRTLSRMLDEISCTIPSRMPSEMLNERTQALYQRFGILERHPPEPPGLSERKLYIRDLAHQGDTPLNPPGPSKHKLYIGDLAYQRNTSLNPPARVNASFISEIRIGCWHFAEC